MTLLTCIIHEPSCWVWFEPGFLAPALDHLGWNSSIVFGHEKYSEEAWKELLGFCRTCLYLTQTIAAHTVFSSTLSELHALQIGMQALLPFLSQERSPSSSQGLMPCTGGRAHCGGSVECGLVERIMLLRIFKWSFFFFSVAQNFKMKVVKQNEREKQNLVSHNRGGSGKSCQDEMFHLSIPCFMASCHSWGRIATSYSPRIHSCIIANKSYSMLSWAACVNI